MSIVSISHDIATVPLAQYQEVERKYKELGKQYEDVVQQQDLWSRIKRNQKMSYTDKFMYDSLVETYPGLLDGMGILINPFTVRFNAGGVSARSATSFFSAMKTIGAISYDIKQYDPKAEADEEKRPVHIIPNPDLFPYPEHFNLKDVEKRKKEREADKKKKQEQVQAWRQWQCEKCGSPNITYDLIAVCKCGHRHAPKTDIIGESITITTVENDDLFDEQVLGEYEPEPGYFDNDIPENDIPWKKRG